MTDCGARDGGIPSWAAYLSCDGDTRSARWQKQTAGHRILAAESSSHGVHAGHHTEPRCLDTAFWRTPNSPEESARTVPASMEGAPYPFQTQELFCERRSFAWRGLRAERIDKVWGRRRPTGAGNGSKWVSVGLGSERANDGDCKKSAPATVVCRRSIRRNPRYFNPEDNKDYPACDLDD